MEGRRSALPLLHGVASGGGKRRRVAATGLAGHRLGTAAPAVVRDEGGREAHGDRAGGRRDRPFAALCHGEGAEDVALRRWRLRSLGRQHVRWLRIRRPVGNRGASILRWWGQFRRRATVLKHIWS